MKKTLNRMESSTLLRFLALWFAFLSQKIRSSNTHYSHIFTNLSKTAFCKDLDFFEQQRYYPVDVPEHHLPHIWDAVYDPILHMVELTTMNRIACRFNHDQWKELLRLFPNHSHQLAYGKISNILIPVEPNINLRQEYYLTDSTVLCQYFTSNHTLVASVQSLKIRGKKPYTSYSTLQIRCPGPELKRMEWTSIQLKLNPTRQVYTRNIFTDETATVPVCNIPTYNPLKKIYRLSVCTATNRAQRDHLVEWIEYHRLVGVDHFFLYDTSVEDRRMLSTTLHDYIHEGVVTVIPWHYMNCVRNMASGRWNAYQTEDGSNINVNSNNSKNNSKSHSNQDYKFFASPRAIAQSAALASCYVRFKHTSKYMTHIDDDEFLTFSPKMLQQQLQLNVQSIRPIHNLVDVADEIFSKYRKVTTIRFEPIMFLPCNITTGIERIPYNAIEYPNHRSVSYLPTLLPRVGVWDLSYIYGDSYECKLIMRTDRVGMFFVHFPSLIELGSWERSRHQTSVTYSINALSVLHYKYPASLKKSVLEGLLPFDMKRDCESLKSWLKIGIVYHAQIGHNISIEWKKKYRERMGVGVG